ncbi:MAG: hypothetical protein AAF675_13415 [Pseudomonadota bacterium]
MTMFTTQEGGVAPEIAAAFDGASPIAGLSAPDLTTLASGAIALAGLFGVIMIFRRLAEARRHARRGTRRRNDGTDSGLDEDGDLALRKRDGSGKGEDGGMDADGGE